MWVLVQSGNISARCDIFAAPGHRSEPIEHLGIGSDERKHVDKCDGPEVTPSKRSYSDSAANLLIQKAANSAYFSECPLIVLKILPDFDSTKWRFESSRPSHLLPNEIRHFVNLSDFHSDGPPAVRVEHDLRDGGVFKPERARRAKRGAQHACATRRRLLIEMVDCQFRPQAWPAIAAVIAGTLERAGRAFAQQDQIRRSAPA
jgi:hypothetical protein